MSFRFPIYRLNDSKLIIRLHFVKAHHYLVFCVVDYEKSAIKNQWKSVEILDFPSVGEQDRVRIQSKPICDILKDLKALTTQRVYNDVEIPSRIPELLLLLSLLKILDQMVQTFHSNGDTSILQPLEGLATSQGPENQIVNNSIIPII